MCLSLCLIGVSGCGGKAGGSPQPTAPKKSALLHVTSTPASLPTVDDVTPTPGDTTTPTATSAVTETPSSGPLETATVRPEALPPRLLSAFVRPSTFNPGSDGTFTVTTVGTARRVDVYLTAGPGSSVGPFTYTLGRDASGRWTGNFTAPTAPGTYYFTVGLYDVNGHRTIEQNESWNLTVSAKQGAGAVEALPADMPLAPGFSYGNPISAVFNAGGHVIQGAEVISTTNTSQNGGALGQFYVTHLARAGWAVDSSTIPAPTAATWTIVATSAGRTAVVQFSGGTLHIFYGTPSR